MARSSTHTKLCVALNGRRVGLLERTAAGAISFFYDKNWLTDPHRAIPVSLSMPLRAERYAGAVATTFFDNLLPDNPHIRRTIAQRTGATGTDAFSLLDKIGRDCVGALQFLPETADIPAPTAPQSIALNEAHIANIIRELASMPLGIRISGDHELRISIAGAQEKTALLWNNGWRLPIGATPTTHILKPSLGVLPRGLDLRHSVENEHFCLTLCKALGLRTANSEIVRFEDITVLAVERFDRFMASDGRLLRLPQEDFCQALGVPASLKYNVDGGPGVKDCIDLLNGSDYAQEDRQAFIKAQIVFWLIGATDGHAKNFSVFLSPGGRFRMTPLYDIMSLQPSVTAKQLRNNQFKLAMAIGDKRHYTIESITPRHVLQSAKAANVSRNDVLNLFSELHQNAPAALEQAVQQMPAAFPMKIVDAINAGLKQRLELISDV